MPPELLTTLDQMFEGLQLIGRDWRYLYLNEAAAKQGQRRRDELLGRTMTECYPGIDQTPMFRKLERAMHGQPQRMDNEFTYPDGSTRWFELRFEPVPKGVVVLSLDITDRRTREQELDRRQRQLDATLAAVPSGVITVDERCRVVELNPMACDMLQCDGDAARGRALFDLVELRDAHSGAAIPLGYGVGSVDGAVCTMARPDGSHLHVVASEARLTDADGRALGVVVALRDVSEAEELHKQLRHAQKMEAIGRLASGVAHDFNNLLTVIMSFASFVAEALPDESPARDDIGEVIGAAKRAEALTRQLLAFSSRRPVRPKVVDVQALLGGLEAMLRRVLTARIAVEFIGTASAWPAFIDPGALEQVIVNLAVNARDAMPEGGRLTIETFNQHVTNPQAMAKSDALAAGDYVVIAVSDDGEGMPPEIAEQIFEPFFTTKGPGKGTGLGLSTCYGIIRQAGGHIAVYSEPGVGTTFRIYLPRAQAEHMRIKPAGSDGRPALRGTGTILVADDDDHVREIVVRTLRSHGYTVLAAANPAKAASLLDEHGAIDLLVTDVVMPGGSGRELADHVQDRCGPTRTLFMSGYTAAAIAHHDVLPEDVELLPKPFEPKDLLARVAQLLGN